MKLKNCVYPLCDRCVYRDCYQTFVSPSERKAQDDFDRDLMAIDYEIRKRRERQARYNKTEKAKNAQKKYFASEKGREAQMRYNHSDKGKNARKRYNQSKKGKERFRRYYYNNKEREIRLMKLGAYLSSLNKPELDEILRICNFTDDEMKVFEMLSSGQSITEVSLELGVSLATAKRRAKGVSEKMKKMENGRNEVPIWEKMTMTIEETAAYSNIGQHKIIELVKNPKCPFVLYVGKKRLIKRKEFEKYISENIEI